MIAVSDVAARRVRRPARTWPIRRHGPCAHGSASGTRSTRRRRASLGGRAWRTRADGGHDSGRRRRPRTPAATALRAVHRGRSRPSAAACARRGLGAPRPPRRAAGLRRRRGLVLGGASSPDAAVGSSGVRGASARAASPSVEPRRGCLGGVARAGGSSLPASSATGARSSPRRRAASRRPRGGVRRRRGLASSSAAASSAASARGRLHRDLAPWRRPRRLRRRLLAAAARAPALALGEVAQQLARRARSACAPCACARRAATSSASGVWASAAASSAAHSRRSCLRAAWTSRRALRACAPPLEFTSRPSSRLVSGQRATAYSSCTSRVYSASRQIHALAWSRRPMRFSASACSMTFDALAALVARPLADLVDRAGRTPRRPWPRRSPAARAGAAASCLLRSHGGQQEAALELAAAVEVQHRPRAAPAARR